MKVLKRVYRMAVLVMILMMTGCGQVAEESREDTPFPVAQEITAGQENNAEQTKKAKQEEFAGNAADERSSFLLSSNGRYLDSLDCTMQGVWSAAP